MHFSIWSLIIAVGVSAAPAKNAATASLVKPPKHKEFAIAFSVYHGSKQTYLSAVATLNQSSSPNYADGFIVVGKPLEVAGTPAYLNGTNPNAALNFDLINSEDPCLNGIYGASVPDFGDAYGAVGDVTATLNYQDFEWGAYNGSIYHRLYSGVNDFFACQDVVNHKKATVLKFGVFKDNSQPPDGCAPTSLIQVFSVPGGAKSP